MPPVKNYPMREGNWAWRQEYVAAKREFTIHAWFAPANRAWKRVITFPRAYNFVGIGIQISAAGDRLVAALHVRNAAQELLPESIQTHLFTWNQRGKIVWEESLPPVLELSVTPYQLVSVNEHALALAYREEPGDEIVDLCVRMVATGDETICNRAMWESGRPAQLIGDRVLLFQGGTTAETYVVAVDHQTRETLWTKKTEASLSRDVTLTGNRPIADLVLLRDVNPGSGSFDRLIFVDVNSGSTEFRLEYSDAVKVAQHGEFISLNYGNSLSFFNLVDQEETWSSPEGIRMTASTICGHVAWVSLSGETRRFNLRTNKLIGKGAPSIYSCLDESTFVTGKRDSAGVERFAYAKLPGLR